MDHRKQRIIDIYGREPNSLDDLAKCVIAVINSQKNTHWSRERTKNAKNIKVVGFSWNISHGMVSNFSHSPLRGELNWDKNSDAPTGYTGWNGRVWIRYAEELLSFGSIPFEMTLTYPGTGGYGGYQGPWENISKIYYQEHGHAPGAPEIYSWDYKFFDDDWPDLYRNELFNLIKDGRPKQHTYNWIDPATAKADEELMILAAQKKLQKD